MSDLRLVCPPGKTPPGGWVAGETVSFRGEWWRIDENYQDTQSNSGHHFHLVQIKRKATGIANFALADDPAWAQGEVVTFNGKSFRVAEVGRTAGRIGYYGVLEPPLDDPDLVALFG